MDLLRAVFLALVGGVVGLVSARLGAYWQLRTTFELERLRLANADRGLLHDKRVEAYSDFFDRMSTARPILRHLRSADESRRSSPEKALDARNEMWRVYTRIALIGHASVQVQALTTIRAVDDVIKGRSPFVEDDYSALVSTWIDICRRGLIPPEAERLLGAPRAVSPSSARARRTPGRLARR